MEKRHIDTLITIGINLESNLELAKQNLNKLINDDYINRLHWKDWDKECDNLKDEELINLLKGAVFIERELNWLGGSVAAGVWIYRNIRKRNLDKDNKIADWIIKNTKNDYLPFGSLR
ncbi:MAG TPA: hypothetical protein VIL99_02150 [Ignavibacteria bacterium]